MPAVLFRPLLALALAAAVVTPAAAAQEPPAPVRGTDIVVTGDADRDAQIRDFVGALTRAPVSGQLARFEESICPAVFGLSEPVREAMVARMRAVAAGVGLRTGGERCTPNVLVMVTRDKQVLIRALARRNPNWFGERPENGVTGVSRQPGPVSVWHAEAVVNADGRALASQGEAAVNQTTRAGSRLQEAARPAFVAAAVVIEADALTGLSTTQVADYAIMRALARADPARLPASAPETILRAIEAPMGSAVPLTLTHWDLGFLRGLYAAPPNLRAPAHRGMISRSVGAEINREDEPEE